MSDAPLRLHGLRSVAGAVCLAFAAAVTVLPSLHLFGHRNDHVHVGDAIVYVGGGVEHDDYAHDHGHPHAHDDDYAHPHAHDPHDDRGEAYGDDRVRAERLSQAAEVDPLIPDLQHGRGSLAHCGAAVLAAPVVVWDAPPSALAEIAIAAPSSPAHLPFRSSPRLTRGPPLA